MGDELPMDLKYFSTLDIYMFIPIYIYMDSRHIKIQIGVFLKRFKGYIKNILSFPLERLTSILSPPTTANDIILVINGII